MRKLFFLSAILLFFIATNVKAQEMNVSTSYITAVGFKFYPGALTVKHFVNDEVAIEGIGYFANYGFRLTGLYEFHHDITDVEGLRWYVGPGAHIGFYDTRYGGGSSFGVDGVLGLDYKIQQIPLNISLDWQPSFEFGNIGYNGFTGGWGGLAFRYTF